MSINYLVDNQELKDATRIFTKLGKGRKKYSSETVFDFSKDDLPPNLSYKNSPILIIQLGRKLGTWGRTNFIGLVMWGAIFFITSLSFRESLTNLNS